MSPPRPLPGRNLLLKTALSGLVGLGVPMMIWDRRLKRSTGSTPGTASASGSGSGSGIVALELVGTARGAEALLQQWGTEGRALARTLLVADQIWLTTYVVTLVAWARPRAKRSGDVAATAAVAAGLCDAVENTVLIGVVEGHVTQRRTRTAQAAAVAKFALVLLSVAANLHQKWQSRILA